ncbi:MAG: 2-amino-4-hydroxy-6-hydroxymethyldihydropteridine diphosphokinase [Myxococcota bacterium]
MQSGGEVAYVAVGANLGDRESVLAQTILAIEAETDLVLRAASPVFETDPVGPAGQGAYLNAMLELDVALSPRALLDRLQAIEMSMGRDRSAAAVRWGARTLDLDLIFFGSERVDAPDLIVPHPRAHLRAFVMRPMAALAPEFIHPVLGLAVERILAGLPAADLAGVRPFARPEGWPVSPDGPEAAAEKESL